ncbi:uncharacterized protein [Cicer arietinum]|uniref:Uncharacterized protein LOC101506147 n=1 Tax=Cicer arietinum TaxID=3827 RepID=A0A1S2YVJ1_CICAR|nr:uncharacterized protein LOC101506147 [Cicer arietinum]
MENNENVIDYFNRVQTITNQMKANREVITEVVITGKIMRILTQIRSNSDEYRSKKVQRDDGEAQLAQEDSSDSYEVLLMASTSMEDDCLGLWYLDTWCSNHMIGHKDWFVIIDEKNNLLSLRRLLEKGYSMNMENGQMKMFDNAKRLILKAPLSKNIIFNIEIQINENQCLAAEIRRED